MSVGTVKHATCEVCGVKLRKAETGRPRRYCGERCKEKSRRRRERELDARAREEAREVGGPGELVTGRPCWICGAREASVGVPGKPPLLCAVCARPS